MSETGALRPGLPKADKRAASLPAFSEWMRQEQVNFSEDASQVMVSRGVFLMLLRPLLLRVRFDEAYYRQANPDLAQAEAAGVLVGMREHYLDFGYFEGRLPCFVEVDAGFYVKEYPDVAVGILEQKVKSAQSHFELCGFKEGRLPRRGWSFGDLMADN